MEPRIEILPEKKFIGIRMTMSLSNNKTSELWRGFIPRCKEIHNSIGAEFYSIQLYDRVYFNDFNPTKEFEKWAAVEVTDYIMIPGGMEACTIQEGLYAVFLHKGAAPTGQKTYQFIFGTWLPQSAYSLDNRPHFEVMGAKYKNDDPHSEEEIWIPVKLKK